MIDNILGENIVHRIDLYFGISSTKDLNSFIGRAAHINLLTEDTLMKLITSGFSNLFDIRVL
jgi:hypothetical protein